MLAFQPSAVVVMDGAVLPVDWVNTTPPAPIVPEYLTESAKYASSAVTRLRRSDFIEARYAFSFVLANFGIAIAAKMPMITTTISSSMSVKPLRFMTSSSLFNDYGQPFTTASLSNQAACLATTICQVKTRHTLSTKDRGPTRRRARTFAACLDYCKGINNERRGNPRRSSCRLLRAAYWQAGAPSLTAAPTGPASLTKMEHVTRGVVRLLFIIDAHQPPPPTLSVPILFPVVGHQLTSPAAGVQATPPTLLVTLVLYLTESRSEERRVGKECRRSDFMEDKKA